MLRAVEHQRKYAGERISTVRDTPAGGESLRLVMKFRPRMYQDRAVADPLFRGGGRRPVQLVCSWGAA